MGKVPAALAALRGEFVDAERESAFRDATLAEDRRHAHLILGLALLFNLAFLASDLRHLGTPSLGTALGLRGAIILFSALAWWSVGSVQTAGGLEKGILAWAGVVFFCSAMFMVVVRGEIGVAVSLVLVLMTYLVFPLSFRGMLGLGAAASLAFLVALFPPDQGFSSTLPGMVILFVMVNVVGAAIAGRSNRMRRLGYLALETERAHLNELRESELKFRGLAECLPNLVWAVSQDGRCVWVNRAWQDFTGSSLEMNLGGGWLDVVHPEDRDLVTRTYAAAFKTLKPFQVEHRLRRADGAPGWVVNSGAPWFDGDGRFAGYIGGCLDATDRRLMEERRQRHSAFQEGLGNIRALAVESLPAEEILNRALEIVIALPGLTCEQGAALYLMDEDGVTLRLVAHRGKGPAAAACFVLPVDRCLCAEAAETGDIVETPHTDEGSEICFPGMADHGHICLPIRQGDEVLGVFSVTLPAGEAAGPEEREFLAEVAGTLGGILARRRVEERVRNERDFTRSVIDALPGVFYLFDAAGRAILWNRQLEVVTGHEGSEIEKMKLLDLVAAEDRERCDAAFATALVEGFGSVEAHLLTRDGQLIPYLFTGRRLEAHGGPCLLGMGVDISARVNVEVALQRSNADLEDFAYAISHDLQEPLRMVSGYLGLLRTRYRDQFTPEVEEFMGFAIDGSQRMQQMIHDLLEYSRVSSRGAKPRPVDSREALEGALENLLRAVSESDAAIEIGAMPNVLADAGQLMRLFQNLVGNALKYQSAENHPVVRIEGERLDGTCRFAVRDNGIGIDPRHHQRIFRVFQRLHGRSEYPGTGIGLAVCKRIVERHGGGIWVESAPGEGATFFFTLPAADQSS